MDIVLLSAATLWTVFMCDKAASSANSASARAEATIDIDHGIEELERNLEAKIRQQIK